MIQTQTPPAKPFSLEDLEKIAEDLMKDRPRSRDMIIMTGSRGAEIFNQEMKREAIRQKLQFAASQGVITPAEVMRLTEMINSSDPGNMTVADAVIDAKLEMNNNGSNI